jgi:DNA-binding transcriptional MerR regulator
VVRGLNIAALSQRTGVAPDTLRKWEQRYGILQPERTTGGQRRYSERDVVRVEWLRARLAEGYRIGEAALLLGQSGGTAARTPREHVEAILAAAERGDAGDIGLRLDQAFALHRLETVLGDVVAPLLREVGARWEAGAISVAQEHVVSEAVRARLGHIVGDAAGGTRGPAVLACAPGERHELGLMSIAIGLRSDGWRIAYLGADTPLRDALDLAARVRAPLLGISLAMRERATALEQALAGARVPHGLTIVVGGGAASEEVAARVGGRYVEGRLPQQVKALRRLAA